MTLEGKPCGVCNKGKLHKFRENISEGVYVDAYKCDDGHVCYTHDVMKKIEEIGPSYSQ